MKLVFTDPKVTLRTTNAARDLIRVAAGFYATEAAVLPIDNEVRIAVCTEVNGAAHLAMLDVREDLDLLRRTR